MSDASMPHALCQSCHEEFLEYELSEEDLCDECEAGKEEEWAYDEEHALTADGCTCQQCWSDYVEHAS